MNDEQGSINSAILGARAWESPKQAIQSRHRPIESQIGSRWLRFGIIESGIRTTRVFSFVLMVKLRTPLVIGTVLSVAVLGIVRLVLFPESWASSLAALAFLPLAIGVLVIRSHSASDPERIRKISGRLRAGLVGAGVLLATSLLLSITDKLGLTGQSDGGGGRFLIIMFPAIVAVAADVLSARLEQKAEKDPD